MTFKVEDGTDVAGANSLATVAGFNAYQGDRGVDISDFGTPDIEPALIRATDFIEQRWGGRFKGTREFSVVSAGRSTLTFTGQPLTAETVTIGTTVFTFGTNVTIGASVAETIDNLVLAAASHPTVVLSAGIGDTAVAVALEKGTAGNGIATTETVTAGSWSSATLLGGGDVLVPQSLSFPRLGLTDRDGLTVLGIPERLRQAVYEYTFRALSATLMPDPTHDSTGRTVNRTMKKVGPIETETQYERGGALSQPIPPYPAADRLLAEYVDLSGGLIRG